MYLMVGLDLDNFPGIKSDLEFVQNNGFVSKLKRKEIFQSIRKVSKLFFFQK